MNLDKINSKDIHLTVLNEDKQFSAIKFSTLENEAEIFYDHATNIMEISHNNKTVL